jgi:RNA polymerase sigma-70 factor (ECF subfamily)
LVEVPVILGQLAGINGVMDEIQRRLRLERLFYAHAGAVRAYARRRVDPTSADDAVSEVFAIAWRRLDDLPEEPLVWLLGCARRVLAHQHRRTRRDTALIARLGAGLHDNATITSDGVLASALETLSERDREVLLLTAWEGLEPGEASTVLGCSRNAFAVRLHRARRRLASSLNQAEADRPSITRWPETEVKP